MIITDSLGQPRTQDNINLYFKETWPYMLNRFFSNSYNSYLPIFSQYGFDTNELKSQYRYYRLIDSDFVILHVGIVDCSRRAVGKKTLRIIKGIPLVRGAVRIFTQKYHFELSRLYNVTYTTTKKYKENLQFFIKQLGSKNVFLVPILPVGKVMKSKSFKIDIQIHEYNSILEQIACETEGVFYLGKISEAFAKNIDKLTFSDSYHLNQKGHRLLYEELKEEVGSIIKNSKFNSNR